LKTRKRAQRSFADASRRYGGSFDLDTKESEVSKLEEQAHAPDFWNDNVAAQKVMQQISGRKTWIEAWRAIERRLADAGSLMELAEEGNDPAYGGEVDAELESVAAGMGDLEFRNMLSGEDDGRNAILTIHAGAGGTEAQDWAEMLLRMYLRWC